MNRRGALLAGAAALTGAATWWAASFEDAPPTVASAGPSQTPGAATSPRSPARDGIAAQDLARLEPARAPLGEMSQDLFPAQSFQPPAPRIAPPPPPKPRAPALPFKLVGILEDGAEVRLFLAEGRRTHIVGAGSKIDTRYRVERVSTQRAEFVYLPLDERQILSLGRAP